MSKSNCKIAHSLKKIAACALALTIFSGCSDSGFSQAQTSTQSISPASSNRVSIPSDQVLIHPAELGLYPEKEYRFPFLGMNLILPDTLTEQLKSHDAILLEREKSKDDGSLSYAFLSWSALTPEQKQEEISINEEEVKKWKDALTPSAVLGVYRSEDETKLNELTGCDIHQKLGETKDGSYSYYLSISSKGNPELSSQVQKIQVTLYEMDNPQKGQSFFQRPAQSLNGTVGNFSTTDIDNSPFDQTLFCENELTLVNVFTTWCSPCVEEIPELEKLREEFSDSGVGVIGIVMDTRNSVGEIDQTAVEQAKVLVERSGVSFPFLIPDPSFFNGLLESVDTVPQTFFVDKNGNLVGETYLGAHSLEEWREIVQKQQQLVREES